MAYKPNFMTQWFAVQRGLHGYGEPLRDVFPPCLCLKGREARRMPWKPPASHPGLCGARLGAHAVGQKAAEARSVPAGEQRPRSPAWGRALADPHGSPQGAVCLDRLSHPRVASGHMQGMVLLAVARTGSPRAQQTWPPKVSKPPLCYDVELTASCEHPCLGCLGRSSLLRGGCLWKASLAAATGSPSPRPSRLTHSSDADVTWGKGLSPVAGF